MERFNSKEGKDQESIQSSATPDPETIWESDKNMRKHDTR